VTFRNGYHFDILVNRFGKVLIDERRIDPNDEWYNDDDYYDRNNDRDRDWDNTNNGDIVTTGIMVTTIVITRDNRDYVMIAMMIPVMIIITAGR
jgi:hypothetical protein